ncbi:MAG: rod shape-determining protein MreD [Solirubrobacterales bacterium]|jgi:rod shape-determining protein MreD|nr:rod shape-determining protein MreD [Solirubrobacterales bacterium]
MPTATVLALRLTALGLLAVLLQVSAVSQLTVFGTNADVVPLVVAFVGLLAGTVNAAIFGFVAGLFIDTALIGTLGLSSLVYVAIGYGAGRLRELRDPQSALVPLAVGAVASAAAAFGFALMQFLLGAEAPVSFELIRQLVVATLVSTLVALPVYAGVRRGLLPALPDDPRRRRRRAYTTGGLSPLSRP